MNPQPIQPALVCPYTLIEEEALAWAIILFNQATLLHPFPLPVPASYIPLMNRGRLEIRSLERSQEEIRIKDRKLRAIQTFIAGYPEESFLKYLRGTAAGESFETQEEITALLKERSVRKDPGDYPAVDGQTLLCLIHGWMMEKWEMEAALAKVEALEKNLTSGWQENSEEAVTWPSPVPSFSKINEPEIPCPQALTAWQELKDQLAPGPANLFTTQRWLWAERFGRDPEEEAPFSVLLPDLGPFSSPDFKNQIEDLASSKSAISPDLEGSLKALMTSPSERSIVDFQRALSRLDLPPAGRYHLILPPANPPAKEPSALGDLKRKGSLILLSAGGR
jgi:hypothetical protein